ncbi:MAG: translation initiation factor [Saprospiraceae bacterium]|nr:translation initiation factor [Saprospiraceae bacterium]
MGKKSKRSRDGFYSTNPDFDGFQQFGEPEEAEISPADQALRVLIDKKGRRGKVVTIVARFRGPESQLEDLARELKSKCGVGGSVKDGEIILQGQLRDKVLTILRDLGYQAK